MVGRHIIYHLILLLIFILREPDILTRRLNYLTINYSKSIFVIIGSVSKEIDFVVKRRYIKFAVEDGHVLSSE